MAGPFCALRAQDRRAAAHSGGPRPSLPASASARPRSGRGPSGGPHGPGLGQPSPHAARAAWCCWRQGRGWGLPSAPSGRVPPAPSACGPHPCPPWAAWAPPAPPACGGRGIVAAGRRLRRLRSAPLRGLPAASRCSGAPPRAARPGPLRGRAPRGLAPLLPLAGRGVGAPGRPAPTRGGFWGGAALRPGRAWLRPAAPRWPACGSARAGAALPPLGPPGVAAPPRCGVPPPSRGAASAPSGRVPCAAAILTPRVRALPALRVAALVRASRGWGAGLRRLRAGLPRRKPSGKAETSRLRRALPDDLRRGAVQPRAMHRPETSLRPRQKAPLSLIQRGSLLARVNLADSKSYAAKTAVSTVRRRGDKGACRGRVARPRRQTSRAGRHRQERT